MFMRTYFQSILVKDFPDEFKNEVIINNRARLGSPDYLQFAALVYVNAATLGLVEAAGGAARHKYRRFKGSHTDPIHLLALDTYLATLNIETARRKEQIRGNFEQEFGRPLNKLETERVWGIVPEINNGEVDRVLKPRHLKESSPRTLVCLPDVERLTEIAALKISGHEAGEMTAGEFAVTKLPFAEKIYGPLGINMRNLFFGRGEKWSS